MLSRKSSGFTLIETLIGLSVFSIFALSLYAAFWNAVKVNQKIEKISRFSRQNFRGLERMALEIENMIPYQFADSDTNKRAFIGAAESISLIKAAPEGLQIVRYFLEEPTGVTIHRTLIGRRSSSQPDSITVHKENIFDAKYLIREEKPFMDDVSSIESLEENASDSKDVLSLNVKSNGLRFFYAYLEGDKQSPKIVWKNQWEHSYLPLKVRVEITLLVPEEKGGILTLNRDVFIPIGSWGEEKL